MNSVTPYSRRKQYLNEYGKLFEALFKIPDEDLRERVSNAVNGIQMCSSCIRKKTKTVDSATQTDLISETSNEIIIQMDIDRPEEPVVKRRRKRKRNCPKVVKTAQHSATLPVLKQENVYTLPKQTINSGTPSRESSMDRQIENVLSALNYDSDFEIGKNETIQKQMRVEWCTAEVVDDKGLLPIQSAIVGNDLNKLKRQLYVWNFRKADLMELRTNEGDNLLQLALKEDCYIRIINELVEQNIDLSEADENCNTIFHLAISNLTHSNEKDLQKLLLAYETLLKKSDLKLLLEKNDDGLTALHIAVKRNEYLIVEKILNVVDELLKVKSVKRLSESCPDVQTFLRHYCEQCDSFEGREQNKLKNQILNAQDMKSGCSLLYLAMELGQEHMIYLLMAHMCDPTLKNLAGFDARTYYNDHGRNSNISAGLEKLTIALQQ